MAEPFPMYVPSDARRLFQTESLLRRFAQMAHWDGDSKLLELYASLGGLALIRALGGELVVVEPEARLLENVKERARLAGVLEQVAFEQHAVTRLDFPQRSFHGIMCFGRVLGTPASVAADWRPLLAENGRVGFTCVVKVGRAVAVPALEYWHKRLGAALQLPREALLAVELAGYEPELVETIGETELTEYYKELEALLPKATDPEGARTLKEELAIHAAYGAGVTLAFIVARRKEPGEKPPLSRDSG
jgi:hypothetical protein